MDPALLQLLAEGSPDDEVAVVLRLADGLAPPAGARIIVRFGPIATCRLQRADIPQVRAEAAVLSMKAPRAYSAEPADVADAIDDAAAEASDLAPRDSDQRRPAPLAETGRGVLVAHIDWGADIAHPDFRDADGRTRFAALWDQGAPYDPGHPNRYGHGRIHNAADIDRALLTDDPYAALGYHPARGKPAGGSHGSHTLGTSAGNGRAGGPLGLAPEAVLAFVDLSTSNQPASAGLGDSAALLEGLDFIAELAQQLGTPEAPLPLVVNASLGRQAGQHDGKTLTEQGMDAFLQAASGRAIVQSTGNYFGHRIHAAGLLRPGAETVLDFILAASHPAHELELWYPASDDIAVQVLGPNGMAPVPAVAGQAATLWHGDRAVGRVYHRRGDPNNGDHQLALYLDASAPGGRWRLRLRGDDVVDGRFHAWVERGPGGGAAQAVFSAEDDSPCCTLGTICNGLRTIAVGGIDAHQPDRPLAPFSSGGPTRDGRAKPDLLAPGVRVLSARSAAADGMPRAALMRMSGTSMAAPHVSGTVALMFAAAPRPLAIHETRRLLLAATAPAPPAADSVSHWRSGAGELDTLAAVAAARQVTPAATDAPASESASASTSTSTSELPAPPPNDTLPIRSNTMSSPTPPPAEAEPLDAAEALPTASCGCAALEASDTAPAFAEAERRKREWRSPAASPLQFQIPIGGGAPSLALPIGGAGSPLAFSLPLGSAPPPMPPSAPLSAPPSAPASVPAAPAPIPLPLPVIATTDPALPALAAVPASAFDAPVLVAGNVDIGIAAAESSPEVTEASWFDEPAPARLAPFGMALLAQAEAACNDDPERLPRSSSPWLRRLLGADLGADPRSFSLRGDGGAAPSATALFNAFVYAAGDPLRHRAQARYRRHLQPLAGPGDRIDALRVQAGDLLLRVALGQGYGQAAVVASPMLCRHDELPAWGWRVPGRHHPREGHFLHVVEVLPQLRPVGERWARRVADARGHLLPGTLLLRQQAPADERRPPAEDWIDAIAEDATADVRWLQNALNQVTGTQLTVDGDAGPATRRAVRGFQQRSGLVADGIAGQRTLAALRSALGSGSGSTLMPTTPQPAGGATSAQRAGDCETLSSFPQGRDTLSDAHRTQLNGVAQRMLRDGIRSVMVTGFASSEGADIDNFVLGMQRASRVSGELREALERVRRGSSGGVAIVPVSRGESDQLPGGDRPQNRRVTVCTQAPVPTPTPATKTFRLVAKSFIARVGSRVGTLNCELDSTVGDIASIVLGPLGGPVLDRVAPVASNAALTAMAAATDLGFSENPTDDRRFVSAPPENKGYRLFSHAELNAQCSGTALLAVSLVGTIDTDAGKECLPSTGLCLQAPPLTVDQPFATRRVDASRVAFRWAVKGRPPTALEPGIQLVCARDSVFIWHQVDGIVDCSSGSPRVTNLALTGSRFPSHRLWLDGTLMQDRPQGVMSALWDGAPGDPTRVR